MHFDAPRARTTTTTPVQGGLPLNADEIRMRPRAREHVARGRQRHLSYQLHKAKRCNTRLPARQPTTVHYATPYVAKTHSHTNPHTTRLAMYPPAGYQLRLTTRVGSLAPQQARGARPAGPPAG